MHIQQGKSDSPVTGKDHHESRMVLCQKKTTVTGRTEKKGSTDENSLDNEIGQGDRDIFGPDTRSREKQEHKRRAARADETPRSCAQNADNHRKHFSIHPP